MDDWRTASDAGFDAGYESGKRVAERGFEAGLDTANARVAVLREGLEMLWRWQGAPDINDETTFSAVEFDRTYGNPEGDGWPAIRALLASPDEAATKLLAWWDAARAWKETYDAIQRAPVLSPQLIAEDAARERAFWATLSATGPGTSEGGQVAPDNARLRRNGLRRAE